MALKSESYLALLKNLLPAGKAWNRSSTSALSNLLYGVSDELARIDQRGTDLLKEIDPRFTSELLADWEKETGLPDGCMISVADSVTERRQDILRKLSTRGGQSAAFFIALAATFGYEVTITNARRFRTGKSRVGSRLWGAAYLHYWIVTAPAVVPIKFRVGQSRTGDRLAVYRNDLLECVISAAAPAHTEVIFAYGGS